MKKRFFTKVTASGENVKLFMLVVDDDKRELYEYYLSDGEWNETSELVRNMINGLPNIDEIDEEKASSLYEKNGFSEAMKKLGGQDG